MRRIISVLAVVALMAAMLVATMLPAFAVQNKVTVCHLSEDGTYEAIEVSANGSAVESHLAHGDFIVVDETTPCPPVVAG